MNLFKLVSFILNPKKAIDYANKNSSDRYKIGYLNEFFSTYLGYGKSNQEIIKLNQKIDKGIKTDNKIANALIELRKIRLELNKKYNIKEQIIKTGKSLGISKGVVTGNVLNITSTKQVIPKNCIGIFPTSGTKYTTQFLKCKGIIFLNGAMTSHGAILAREFNIPAIVFPNLNIRNNTKVTINGNTGQITYSSINA